MSSTHNTAQPGDTPTIAQQMPILQSCAAGFVGHRTITIGLRNGLFEALAEHGPLTVEELAKQVGADAFYTGVWCRAAFGAGVLARDGDGYRLATHMNTLLLDSTSPAYIGAVFLALEQPEVFDRFERVLPTGERLWWDECSPEWIASVAGTGTPFNTRLVPNGLAQVPGLVDRLGAGGRIVDTACGAGVGLVRLAQHYPECDLAGIDGDAHSLELARGRLAEAGVADRVELVHTPLEEMTIDPPAALVVNNISMHECRDRDEVARRVYEGLEPGGWFVISDFPFPDTDDGLASLPGRVMSGIQYFEAQIDDQLLPRAAYDELLTRHGFTDLGHAEIMPMHALTWGRRAA